MRSEKRSDETRSETESHTTLMERTRSRAASIAENLGENTAVQCPVCLSDFTAVAMHTTHVPYALHEYDRGYREWNAGLSHTERSPGTHYLAGRAAALADHALKHANTSTCSAPGCLAHVPMNAPLLPDGWTRIVVSAPPAGPCVRLRCPSHPLPPGGIVTMGDKQVSPPAAREALLRDEPDPDRPCEKEHPELERLCGALRTLGVPCDGYTPAADAVCAINAAQSRARELAAFVERLDMREPACPGRRTLGPHQAALTDYLSGRYIPGTGPELIDTVESLCQAALALLKHNAAKSADQQVSAYDEHATSPDSEPPASDKTTFGVPSMERCSSVWYLMDRAMAAVSPSDLVSSHVKGDVLRLLERLRDAEILRVAREGAKQ